MSFKIAPGVRVRASSRGLSAGVGPRAARVHVGTRGVGVSSGVGPVSAYTRLGGSTRRSTGAASPASRGPTKASIAAHERELRAAQREADIDKVAALEAALVSVHKQSFPRAAPMELPAPDEVDPKPIEEGLEAEAGIPGLLELLGGGESPPLAAEPEPVDRYELMREHRKRGRAGIPFYRIKDLIEAARQADSDAEVAAAVEAKRRAEAQRAEQARLDDLWADLTAARATVADGLSVKVAAEQRRRQTERDASQKQLDDDWASLNANDAELTMGALEEAFADNESPAAPLDCEGDQTTVAMQFAAPEAIVPERKPAHTPTGKRTLKKRTKTETNALYLQALGSHVLATVKEAFAVAPGTNVVQMLVIRHETAGKQAGNLTAIYAGQFDRQGYEGASGSRDPGKALTLASEATINLKGKTAQVSPLDLAGAPDLEDVLRQVEDGLSS